MLPPVKQVHSKPLSHATTARLRPSESFRDVGKLSDFCWQEDVGQRAVEFERKVLFWKRFTDT